MINLCSFFLTLAIMTLNIAFVLVSSVMLHIDGDLGC